MDEYVTQGDYDAIFEDVVNLLRLDEPSILKLLGRTAEMWDVSDNERNYTRCNDNFNIIKHWMISNNKTTLTAGLDTTKSIRISI